EKKKKLSSLFSKKEPDQLDLEILINHLQVKYNETHSSNLDISKRRKIKMNDLEKAMVLVKEGKIIRSMDFLLNKKITDEIHNDIILFRSIYMVIEMGIMKGIYKFDDSMLWTNRVIQGYINLLSELVNLK
ncbi:MAG: hypothetical protein KDD63_23535, partial [Bacteroidetes bacterium]|nr:hypothetical protein [Bacteroidota bacterium]